MGKGMRGEWGGDGLIDDDDDVDDGQRGEGKDGEE